MAKYEVQRKIIAWESQIVEADSFDDAVEKADEDFHAYHELTETFEPTGNYFVTNLETDETEAI